MRVRGCERVEGLYRDQSVVVMKIAYLTISERIATNGSKFRCSSLHSVSIRRVT